MRDDYFPWSADDFRLKTIPSLNNRFPENRRKKNLERVQCSGDMHLKIKIQEITTIFLVAQPLVFIEIVSEIREKT